MSEEVEKQEVVEQESDLERAYRLVEQDRLERDERARNCGVEVEKVLRGFNCRIATEIEQVVPLGDNVFRFVGMPRIVAMPKEKQDGGNND